MCQIDVLEVEGVYYGMWDYSCFGLYRRRFVMLRSGWLKRTVAGFHCVAGFSGCHRYEAHQKLGLPTIKCKIRRGTRETLRCLRFALLLCPSCVPSSFVLLRSFEDLEAWCECWILWESFRCVLWVSMFNIHVLKSLWSLKNSLFWFWQAPPSITSITQVLRRLREDLFFRYIQGVWENLIRKGIFDVA